MCTSCTHLMCIKRAALTQASGTGWISADLLQHFQGVYCIRVLVPPLSSTAVRFVGCCQNLSDFVPLKTHSTRGRSIPRSLQRWVSTKNRSHSCRFLMFLIYAHPMHIPILFPSIRNIHSSRGDIKPVVRAIEGSHTYSLQRWISTNSSRLSQLISAFFLFKITTWYQVAHDL